MTATHIRAKPYPDAAHNQIYIGRQPQYNTYKQLLGQRIALVGQNSEIIEETAGPDRIIISWFNGWGPRRIERARSSHFPREWYRETESRFLTNMQ
jgi:hypothetical protein